MSDAHHSAWGAGRARRGSPVLSGTVTTMRYQEPVSAFCFGEEPDRKLFLSHQFAWRAPGVRRRPMVRSLPWPRKRHNVQNTQNL